MTIMWNPRLRNMQTKNAFIGRTKNISPFYFLNSSEMDLQVNWRKSKQELRNGVKYACIHCSLLYTCQIGPRRKPGIVHHQKPEYDVYNSKKNLTESMFGGLSISFSLEDAKVRAKSIPSPCHPTQFLFGFSLKKHGISHYINSEEYRLIIESIAQFSKDELHFMILIKPKLRQELNNLASLQSSLLTTRVQGVWSRKKQSFYISLLSLFRTVF